MKSYKSWIPCWVSRCTNISQSYCTWLALSRWCHFLGLCVWRKILFRTWNDYLVNDSNTFCLKKWKKNIFIFLNLRTFFIYFSFGTLSVTFAASWEGNVACLWFKQDWNIWSIKAVDLFIWSSSVLMLLFLSSTSFLSWSIASSLPNEICTLFWDFNSDISFRRRLFLSLSS